MFSVELVTDPAIERSVRLDWERLGAAHLPHAGSNPSPSNRPHVTLAVRDEVRAEELAEIAALLPLPLELGGVLLFGHERRFVVSRQVVVTAALLSFHREVARIVGPPEPRYANTGPDRWTPHVTLARRVSPDQLPQVLGVIGEPRLAGEAVGLRVWDAAAKVVTTLR